MRAQCAHLGRALSHQKMACAVEHEDALRFGRLNRHEAHVWPRYRLADCLGIGCVVLVALDVRLHVGRRHQPHLMPEGAEFAGPMARRRAGLDADKAEMQTTE